MNCSADDSENIIPSSESDPPPPITYTISHFLKNHVNQRNSEYLSESVNETCPSNPGNSTWPPMFTQADDFQDLTEKNVPSRTHTKATDCGQKSSAVPTGKISSSVCKYTAIHEQLEDISPSQIPMMTLSEKIMLHSKTNDVQFDYANQRTSLPMLCSVSEENVAVFPSVSRPSEPTNTSSLKDRRVSAAYDEVALDGRPSNYYECASDIRADSQSEPLETATGRISIHLSVVKSTPPPTDDSTLPVFEPLYTSGVVIDMGSPTSLAQLDCMRRDCETIFQNVFWLLASSGSGSSLMDTSDKLSRTPPMQSSVSPRKSFAAANSASRVQKKAETSSNQSNRMKPSVGFMAPFSQSMQHRAAVAQYAERQSSSSAASGPDLFRSSQSGTEQKNHSAPFITGKAVVRLSETSTTSSGELFIPRSKPHILKHRYLREAAKLSSSGAVTADAAVHEISTPKEVGEVVPPVVVLAVKADGKLPPKDVTLSKFTGKDLSNSASIVLATDTASGSSDVPLAPSLGEQPAGLSILESDCGDKPTAKRSFLSVSKTRGSSSLDTSSPDNDACIPVYAKWHPQPYYYAGRMALCETGVARNTRMVYFDDGSSARIKVGHILLLDLLPVGAEVSVDCSNKGEYWGHYVVKALLPDTPQQPYQVVHRTEKENRLLPVGRRQVAIHTSQVSRLRSQGLLSGAVSNNNNNLSMDGPENVDQPVEDVLSSGLPSAFTMTPSSMRSVDAGVKRMKISSPDVSLINVVFGKRESKAKRYRSSWVTPLGQFACREDATPRSTRSFRHSALAGSTKAYRSSHSLPTNRRGKCTRALATSRTRSPLQQPRGPATTGNWQLDDENWSTQPMRVSPSSEIRPADKHDRLSSTPATPVSFAALNTTDFSSSLVATVTRASAPTTSAAIAQSPDQPRDAFNRKLGVPKPSEHLFSQWVVIFTGNWSCKAKVGRLSGEPGVPAYDRQSLEQLVLAAGGRLATELTPCDLPPSSACLDTVCGSDSPLLIDSSIVISTAEPADAPHYHQCTALVALDCCRTVKYFQALASLGQVPMLHADWLLEACREEARHGGGGVDPSRSANLPLELLRRHPGRYELPRGAVDLSGQPTGWSAVPAQYLWPNLTPVSPASSLFALNSGWLPSDTRAVCHLAAIVTGDLSVFGPVWRNILQLAAGLRCSAEAAAADQLASVPLVNFDDAVDCLRQLALQLTDGAVGCALVLVDKTHLPPHLASSLRTLPFGLVTSDYFIHCLIRGQLLDPSSSSFFNPCPD